MAGKIKGITIEFRGDTTNFDKALRTIKSETKSLDSELRNINKALKFNPGNTELLAQKQQVLTQRIGETKEKLDTLKAAQAQMDASGVDKTSNEYMQLRREIIETESQLKHFNAELIKVKAAQTSLGQLGTTLTNVGSKAKQAATQFQAISAAAALGIGAAVRETAQFDSAMSNVKAISGATAKEFEQLRDKAREMGQTTKFTATESADALSYMAMAGWKTEDMLGGLEGVMYLAAASGEDLAMTSDIVTDALTALNYSASDSTRLADVMAAASANANTNVGLMGETFKYAAAVAGSLKYSMEDVALATGLMANAGIKGTQAGTSLRSMMTRLAAPPKACAAAMDQLGISIENADGTTKPFRDVLVELREKMAGLSETEKTAIANNIAGKNAMSGMLAIINASDEDFNKLADAIDNADGSAREMADTMMDNLGGQITLLKSNLGELAIAIGDTLVPIFRNFVDATNDLVTWFNNLSEGTKQTVAYVGLLVAGIAPALAIFGTLADAVGKGFTRLSEFGVKLKEAGGLSKLMSAAPFLAIAAVLAVAYTKSEAFREAINSLVGSALGTLKTIMESLAPVFTSVMSIVGSLAGVIGTALAPVIDMLAAGLTALQPVITFIGQCFEGLANIIAPVAEVINSKFSDSMKSLNEIFSGFGEGISRLVDKIKGLGDKSEEGAKRVSGSLAEMSGSSGITMGQLKEEFNSAADVVNKRSNEMGTVTTKSWSEIKKSTAESWANVKKAVVDALASLYSKAADKFNSIKSTATSTFNKVKSAITTPIKTAVEFIKTQVDKIKGFFSGLKLSLPKIKLPHFKLTGKFSLEDLTVPHLSVSWYKNGSIFDGPSVVGVGEAGKEAVVPLSGKEMKPFAEAIAENMGGTGDIFNINITIPVDRIKDLMTVNDFIDMIQGIKTQYARG